MSKVAIRCSSGTKFRAALVRRFVNERDDRTLARPLVPGGQGIRFVGLGEGRRDNIREREGPQRKDGERTRCQRKAGPNRPDSAAAGEHRSSWLNSHGCLSTG